MEDEKIVGLYLDRDESAISETSGKYGARLRALSFGITSDAQTAEECENDTYLQAWNSIPPNEPRTYLYAFLARITRHISIDRCRAQASLKRDAYIVEIDEELAGCVPAADSAESSFDAKELGETVDAFLLTLPREKRVIFTRRYFYMDSISEISRRCSVSESKVKTTLFRIRNGLREYLAKRGYCI